MVISILNAVINVVNECKKSLSLCVCVCVCVCVYSRAHVNS